MFTVQIIRMYQFIYRNTLCWLYSLSYIFHDEFKYANSTLNCLLQNFLKKMENFGLLFALGIRFGNVF